MTHDHPMRGVRISVDEWQAVAGWLTNAMKREDGESIDAWRDRTAPILAIEYDQALDMAGAERTVTA